MVNDVFILATQITSTTPDVVALELDTVILIIVFLLGTAALGFVMRQLIQAQQSGQGNLSTEVFDRYERMAARLDKTLPGDFLQQLTQSGVQLAHGAVLDHTLATPNPDDEEAYLKFVARFLDVIEMRYKQRGVPFDRARWDAMLELAGPEKVTETTTDKPPA